jgi:hypothetical protein
MRAADLAWFAKITGQFGLAGRFALLGDDGKSIAGLSFDEIRSIAKSAELLVNISGHLRLGELKELPRIKVFIDEDPGYTQMWQASGVGGTRLEGHDHYFTLGQNIGREGCTIPACGIRWRAIRPPVVLDWWPACDARRDDDVFTTVASWRGAFGPLTYAGNTFGQKAHEFRKFIDLPRRTGQAFELALDIHAGDQRDIDSLQGNGWRLVDPKIVAPDPLAFRNYVQSSYAEFSVAQGVYVATNSGWFSDRTARYLASGKPAVVQETGFSQTISVGEGLLSFRTLDEAADCVKRVKDDYARHSIAARKIAEEFFDSDRVLGAFLREIDLKS